MMLTVGVESAPASGLTVLAAAHIAPVLLACRTPARPGAHVVAFVSMVVCSTLATIWAGLAGRSEERSGCRIFAGNCCRLPGMAAMGAALQPLGQRRSPAVTTVICASLGGVDESHNLAFGAEELLRIRDRSFDNVPC